MSYLEGFSNRLKLTIPAGRIPADQTDFPVMIKLSDSSGMNSFDATSVFDELSNDDRKKIAVTTGSGIQCYTEIDYWDSVGKKATLWSKVPTIYSAVETELFLYYDSSVADNGQYVSEVNPIVQSKHSAAVIKGSEGTYDSVHASSGPVIKDNGIYRMWYQGYDGSNGRGIHCTSTDAESWTGHQLSLDIGNETGGTDAQHAVPSTVIKDGDVYKMWYMGTAADGVENVNYCTSASGYNWSNFQSLFARGTEGTYDVTYLSGLCVVKDSDTSYKMWYGGYVAASGWSIIYCDSSDGINWSNYQRVISKGSEGTYDNTGVYGPDCVKEQDGTYTIYYTGYTSGVYYVHRAKSTDGINWGDFEMFISGDQVGYDSNYCYGPRVLLDDDKLRVWYIGYDGSSNTCCNYYEPYTTTRDVWPEATSARCVHHMSQTAPTNRKTLLGSSYRNASGNPAVSRGSVSAQNCTGLTKENGYLVVDLACSPSALAYGGQFEITSAGTQDIQEWALSITREEFRQMTSGFQTFVFPLTRFYGTTLNVASINFVGWYVYCKSGNVSIWYRNVRLIWDCDEHNILLDSGQYRAHYPAFDGSMSALDVVEGPTGKALEFDGVNDKIDTTTEYRSSNNFAYSAWIQATTTHQIDSESNSGTAGTSGQRFAFAPFGTDDSGISVGTNGISVYEHGSGYLPPLAVYDHAIGSDFNHVSVVYYDRRPTIFLNGEPVHAGQTSGKNPIYSPGGIGGHSYGYFPGKIGTVRYINSAPTPDRVKTNYINESDNLFMYESGTASGTETLWLDDWADRIKFSVDHTKIDELLEDFPMHVPVTISGVFEKLNVTNSGTINSSTKLVLPPVGDYSDSGHVITTFGAPKIYKNPTASGMLGSVYLDGSDDYLYTGNNADFYFSTGDFTIDCWIYIASFSDHRTIVSKVHTSNPYPGWYFRVNLNGGVDFISNNNSAQLSTAASVIPLSTWTHVALVKYGTGAKIYVNGVERGSAASPTIQDYDTTLKIGTLWGTSYYYFYGNLTELRISKGIARWTANFTPPTAPYEPDSYTKLLLHFEGDRSGRDNVLTINGAMDIYPPTGSDRNYDFDGSNDYITIPNSSDWDFGTGDFTIAFWANVTDNGSYSALISTLSNDTTGWAIMHHYQSDLIRLQAYDGSSYYFGDIVPDYGEWAHYAWVRRSGTVYTYKNGELANTVLTTHAINDTSNAGLYLGRYYSNQNSNYFQGYVEQLEIHKGNAVWDGAFTPPPLTIPNDKKIAITTGDGVTQCPVEIENWDADGNEALLWTKAPLIYADRDTDFYLYFDKTKPDNSNIGDVGDAISRTVWDNGYALVCHMQSGLIDSANGYDGTNVGSDVVDGKIDKARAFPNTADKITFPTTAFSSENNFTIETILTPTSETSSHAWEAHGATSDPSLEGTSADLNFWVDGSNYVGTGVLTIGEDHYVACAYNSATGSQRLFLNDSLNDSDTYQRAFTSWGSYLNVGNRGNGSSADARNYGGKIEELRVSTIARSDAWLKATYHSNWGTLLTFDSPTEIPVFGFSGVVKVGTTPAARTVNLYRRSTGELVGTTVSDANTGEFVVESRYNELHYVVVLPETSEGFNIISYDQIDPGA
jgi:hypothetical protein